MSSACDGDSVNSPPVMSYFHSLALANTIGNGTGHELSRPPCVSVSLSVKNNVHCVSTKSSPFLFLW